MPYTTTYGIGPVLEEVGHAIDSGDYSQLSEEEAHRIQCYLTAIYKDQQFFMASSYEWKMKGDPYTRVNKEGVNEVVVDVEAVIVWEGERRSGRVSRPPKPAPPSTLKQAPKPASPQPLKTVAPELQSQPQAEAPAPAKVPPQTYVPQSPKQKTKVIFQTPKTSNISRRRVIKQVVILLLFVLFAYLAIVHGERIRSEPIKMIFKIIS